MTTKNHNAHLRQRPYILRTLEVTGPTDTDRFTVVSPRKGYRIRLVRLQILQKGEEDRFYVEVYFGTAGNIITDPTNGIDILQVNVAGSAKTRTFPRGEGPRGLRGEPVSIRYRTAGPSGNSHSSNDLTCARGLNGTTAFAHADSVDIYILRWHCNCREGRPHPDRPHLDPRRRLRAVLRRRRHRHRCPPLAGILPQDHCLIVLSSYFSP